MTDVMEALLAAQAAPSGAEDGRLRNIWEDMCRAGDVRPVAPVRNSRRA